jgi:1,4-dihydroxy-2-naphthoate octaprenyltransferase
MESKNKKKKNVIQKQDDRKELSLLREQDGQVAIVDAFPEAPEKEARVTTTSEAPEASEEEIPAITPLETLDTAQEEEETPTIVTPVVGVHAVVTPVDPGETILSSEIPAPERSPDQDSSGDCVAEEATDDVTEEVTDDVTEEATDDVVEEVTDDVTEEVTDDVVEEVTDDVTEQRIVTTFDDNEVTVVESVPPVSEVAARRQSAQIVPADSVRAEEVPTVSIGDLQVLKELEPEVSVHSVASMRAINLPTPLVAQPTEYRRGSGEWIDIWRDGMRFKYVQLSLLPVILGSILAWTQSVSKQHILGHLGIIHFIAAIIAVILMQVGANLINDYYDYKRGVDTSNALGPGGLIQQGLIKPTRVLMTGLTVLVAGTMIGLVFALAGGVLAVLMVVLLALAAYFFSAGRRSLSSLGLSELVGFLAFGPLTFMTGYLMQTHGVYTTRALVYSLPLGLLGAAVVYANNLRDAEGDQHVGKYTLATLLGLRRSRFVYSLLLLAADAIIAVLGVRHGAPHLILISLWTLPILAVAVSGILRTEIVAGFHDVMKQTLKLQMCFAVLLLIALIVSTVFSSLVVTLPTMKLPFL